MFNIGFGELAVICIVLIIAVGPERLPSMMKTLGKTIRTLRQASRDIRASTGIDELMREDFDLYAPVKPSPPRRPAPQPALPAQAPTEPASPGSAQSAEATVPTTPAANVETTTTTTTTTTTEPKPVSREEVVEEVESGRPSVVVAPPPQPVGLPSDEPTLQPTAAVKADASPLPPAPDPTLLLNGQPAAASPPFSSHEDTLPRAAILSTADTAPAVTPETPNKQPEPLPEAEAAKDAAKPSGA
jgi:Tat protein translocase TatB subunit